LFSTIGAEKVIVARYAQTAQKDTGELEWIVLLLVKAVKTRCPDGFGFFSLFL
jgi:hypothetical protein